MTAPSADTEGGQGGRTRRANTEVWHLRDLSRSRHRRPCWRVGSPARSRGERQRDWVAQHHRRKTVSCDPASPARPATDARPVNRRRQVGRGGDPRPLARPVFRARCPTLRSARRCRRNRRCRGPSQVSRALQESQVSWAVAGVEGVAGVAESQSRMTVLEGVAVPRPPGPVGVGVPGDAASGLPIGGNRVGPPG